MIFSCFFMNVEENPEDDQGLQSEEYAPGDTPS